MNLQMNIDLEKVSLWAYQWNMPFNPDISKEAEKIIFSKKNVNAFHPLYVDRTPLIRCSYQNI